MKLLLLISLALISLGCQPAAEKPPVEERFELTTFAKQVLLNLDALYDHPGAAGFNRELDAVPGLRPALQQGAAEADRRRLQTVVDRFADDAAFQEAVRNPAPPADSPPCAEPEPAKPNITDGNSGLLDAEPGCAKSAAPGEEPDLLAPKARPE
ncbi:MAG: hypothetical protein ABIJ96_14485 [Elusimicrobiota bacterium]